MQKHRIIKASFFIFALVLFSGCYYDNKSELYPQSGICDTAAVTFSAFVKPKIASQCNSCHAGNPPLIGKVALSNYTEISASAKNKTLYGSLSHASGYKPMPQGGSTWSDCDLKKLQKWIDNGAQNN